MSPFFASLVPMLLGLVTGLAIAIAINLKYLEKRVKELEERENKAVPHE